MRQLQDKSAKMERGLERKTLELSSIEQEIAKVKQYDEGAAKARREARWAKMATIEEDIKTKSATAATTEQHNVNVQNTINELDHTVNIHNKIDNFFKLLKLLGLLDLF